MQVAVVFANLFEPPRERIDVRRRWREILTARVDIRPRAPTFPTRRAEDRERRGVEDDAWAGAYAEYLGERDRDDGSRT